MTTTRTPRPSSALNPTRQQLDELDALLQRMLELPVHQGEESPAPLGTPDRAAPERLASESFAPPPSVARPPRPEPVPIPPRIETPRPMPAPEPLPRPKTYPASYMVIETATPPFYTQQEEIAEEPVPPRESPPIAPPEETSDEGEWVPLRSSWRPSAQTWGPLAATWEQQARAPQPELVPAPQMQSWRMEEATRMPDIPPAPEEHPEEPMPTKVLSRGPAGPTVTHTPAPRDELAFPEIPTRPKVSPAPPPTRHATEAGHGGHSVAALPLVWCNDAFDALLRPLGPIGRWFQGQSGRTLLGVTGLVCLIAATTMVLAEGIGWTW